MPLVFEKCVTHEKSGQLYFEDLAGLDRWCTDTGHIRSLDILPYVPRNETPSGAGKGKLLVCHDYKGGYTESPEAPAYTFNFWDRCDTFIYFSHQRVTIPPPGWIHAAHRHGVKILGVLIFEHEQSAEDNVRLLLGSFRPARTGPVSSDTPTGLPISRHYARALADLAYERGFDGYLVNAEHPLSGRSDQVRAFEAWVSLLQQELKRRLGDHAQTIWYDSIVPTGDVAWQNRLNSRNLQFFLAADSIFTNYFWHWPANLQIAEYLSRLETKHFQSKLKTLQDIFVGIDVWGRGTHGGGGFGAFKALEHIQPQSLGLSAAIFGPAWTWEDGEGSEGRTWETWWAREQTLWVGLEDETTVVELPHAPMKRGEPSCSHQSFEPIGDFFSHLAPPDPKLLPFWTTFSPGIGFGWFVEGRRVMQRTQGWTDIDKQTTIGDLLWPRPAVFWEEFGTDEKLPAASTKLTFVDAFNGGSCVTVSLSGDGNAEASGFRCLWIPIQTLSLSTGEAYEIQLAYKLHCEGGEVEPALSVRQGTETAGFDIQTQPAMIPKHGWYSLSIICRLAETRPSGINYQVGLVLGAIFENPAAAYNITFQLGQLSAVHRPSLEGLTPFKTRLVWADCQHDVRDANLLKLQWEPSIVYTVPAVLREADLHPEVTHPPWNLSRSNTWFPRVLYSNVYAQVRTHNDASSLSPSTGATFLGTSGWGSGSWLGTGPNEFEVRKEELPDALRQGSIRFYVQPVTDRGEVLVWGQCAFVDFDW